ncbi:spore cortex biosynthesis protein YabQ [Pullulanibacillus camelliae]|uniref:Spore cortex biosynthesis protein YabQ n=1 Tax=Pullulanibacillus camelliae TaxID=1707096 RepID=A0A8J2YMY7_9BACL|nr:spore cortex biosynthesis protein YabQ [Pullulanibacillus camelliae]GGE54100.1 spore cortex biosynthesis protein YabQ [Pullulanibacillus camelliae]
MTLSEQFATMLAMTAMGGWIGLALSTYHRLIQPEKKWQWVTLLTDVFFWVVQGLLIFYVLLTVNQGEIRFYILLALVCGFAAYKALFETIYERCLDFIIRLFVRIGRLIKRIIFIFFVHPTKFLLKLLYQLFKMVSRIFIVVLLFILTVIITPIKFILKLVIPSSWRRKIGQLIQTFRQTIEALIGKFR